jgi:hypothetical protein
MNYIEV